MTKMSEISSKIDQLSLAVDKLIADKASLLEENENLKKDLTNALERINHYEWELNPDRMGK